MSEFKMDLPSDVLFILDRMNKRGYSAHVVGGSVRDSLLGRELGDFDITTDALPEETKEVFSDHKTVDTGIRHGTVTLVLSGVPYEITTYRVDGDYKDNRHPDSVSFTTSLADDLARRDFTVNAMAYSPTDSLTDIYGGREDAERRIIRAVGDPYVRFSEDALRILRALRFASVLGFDIEETTSRAAFDLAANLSSISKERVYTELKKLILGRDAIRILKDYSDILSLAFSGMRIETLPCDERFSEADYHVKLASLFYLNSDSPIETAEQTLADLKTDKFTRTHVCAILYALRKVSFADRNSALRHLAKYGEEVTKGALSLGIALGKFGEMEKTIYTDAINSGIPYKISGLDIRGGDLTAIGYRGESVGAALEKLLFDVIDEKVENKRAELIAHLTRH